MNPSYFRIRLPKSDAMERFDSWIGLPELEPPKVVTLLKSVDEACDENGHWRGSALYVYEKDGWTVFEDLSGHCGSIPADSWLSFAESDEFVFAGYNDAIGYGELIVIENGTVVREFLYDSDNPEVNINRGELTGSSVEPMKSWVEAARFVDDDDLTFSENGLLWLHGNTAGQVDAL
jgi:hypothetical protein